jgi:hypothetical protein
MIDSLPESIVLELVSITPQVWYNMVLAVPFLKPYSDGDDILDKFLDIFLREQGYTATPAMLTIYHLFMRPF